MSNPPDKFATVPLTSDPIADLDAINNLADEGYTQTPVVLPYATGPVLLMGGYKGN